MWKLLGLGTMLVFLPSCSSDDAAADPGAAGGSAGTGGATGGSGGVAGSGSSAGSAGASPGTPSCDAVVVDSVDSLPIVPGRRGYGLSTVAGSGREGGASTLFRVTNLNAAGPGSLLDCIDAEGPRVCVFEVSGTITYDGSLEVRNPYLTIAGQTAPSPGITLRNATFGIVNTHDVLVQHVRIRVGDEPSSVDGSNRDAIAIGSFDPTQPTHDIVIDHVSASWGTDETVSIWGDGGAQVHDVAILDSIVSEALRCSIHPEGCHSAGMIIGRNTQRVVVTGTLFAHNDWRNPLVRDAFDEVLVANNVVFADGGESLHVADGINATLPAHADLMGNSLTYLKATVGTTDPAGTFVAGSSFHFADNACDDGSGDACVQVDGIGADFLTTTPTLAVPGFVAETPAAARARVLGYSGARPADRDEVDVRVVADVTLPTPAFSALIDSQNDVGGWPSLAENQAVFDDPPEPDSIPATDPYTGLGNPGYTLRELYLHELARLAVCGIPSK